MKHITRIGSVVSNDDTPEKRAEHETLFTNPPGELFDHHYVEPCHVMPLGGLVTVAYRYVH